jgi:hypothetical protein
MRSVHRVGYRYICTLRNMLWLREKNVQTCTLGGLDIGTSVPEMAKQVDWFREKIVQIYTAGRIGCRYRRTSRKTLIGCVNREKSHGVLTRTRLCRPAPSWRNLITNTFVV